MIGKNLYLEFNNQVIYEDANFCINNNDIVGVVGVNGAGKTTLFNVILKKQELDSGSIIYTSKANIGYLPQEIIIDNNNVTVLDYLLSARPIDNLNNKLTKLYEDVSLETDTKKQNRIMKEISKTQELLEYYDCYEAENILFDIIEKMSIDLNLLDMKLNELSGGQKSKIAFAHLLYSKSEILLLDEPTNHLDKSTRDYVIDYLKNYHGCVLIISHDIELLDSIINKTMYIDKITKKIKIYNGNYSTFQKKLKQEQEIKERLIKKQEQEEEKLRSIVLKYSNSSGKRKKMAQSREKTLNKLLEKKEEKVKSYNQVSINLSPRNTSSKIPLKVNNLYFKYEDKYIIENLSFMIEAKERLLISGKNGVGKTTLTKLICKILEPNSGSIQYGLKTEIAYYDQQQENLDLSKNIIENLDGFDVGEKEKRSALAKFLFYGDDIFKSVDKLSPGERARLCLCKIMLKRANLLILDEPTNHLDPETQRVIGENFKNYSGTIILVSHNETFIKCIGIDRILHLPSGKITNY